MKYKVLFFIILVFGLIAVFLVYNFFQQSDNKLNPTREQIISAKAVTEKKALPPREDWEEYSYSIGEQDTIEFKLFKPKHWEVNEWYRHGQHILTFRDRDNGREGNENVVFSVAIEPSISGPLVQWYAFEDTFIKTGERIIAGYDAYELILSPDSTLTRYLLFTETDRQTPGWSIDINVIDLSKETQNLLLDSIEFTTQ